MRREVAGGPGPKGKRGDPITGFLGISGPIGDKVLSQMPGSGWSASNRVAFGGDDKEDEKEGEGDGSDQVQEESSDSAQVQGPRRRTAKKNKKIQFETHNNSVSTRYH